jgi:hypothetical protein
LRRLATILAVLLPIAVVAVVDWWVVSAGRWRDWPRYTALTDSLADAFRHGRVSLLSQPPRELIALPNPYDAKANRAFREQGAHDLALYRGHYYLYWGPLPALLLAAMKTVAPRLGTVGDQHIAYVFSLLSILASALLLHWIWRRFFSRAPLWTLSLLILSAGLVTPMPFLLARASAYEVAILAGQFFLLLGVYYGLRALQGECDAETQTAQRTDTELILSMRPSVHSVSLWRILFCGISWAAAIGSRISLAPWVAVLCLALIYACYRRGRIAPLLLACVPVGLSVLGLLVYNHARFGSFSESGVRYMLASNSAQRAILGGHMFGPVYAPANVVNYLVTPPNVMASFPFVQAKVYGLGLLRRHYEPKFYHVNTVAGLIPTAPALLLAIVPPIVWLRARRWNPATLAMTVVGAVAAIAPVMLLYNCTMRYLADWVPTLVVLSAVGWWIINEPPAPRRRLWNVLIVAAVVYSVVIGVLLSVSGYTNHFRTNNPALFEQLSQEP